MNEALPLTIVDFPNYQRIADEAIKMYQAGSTMNAIAVALEIDPSTVKAAIRWGEKNDTRFLPKADFSVRRKLPNSKTDKIGPEVARMKDIEGLTFEQIAEKQNTTGGTVSRAYKQFHSQKNHAAVCKGDVLNTHPKRRKISQEKIKLINDLVAQGTMSKRAIARRVGVSAWTVRQQAKRMASKA